MSLTNLGGLFAPNDKSAWAVGHFNIHNHEFIRAVIDAAEEEQAPAILAIGKMSIDHMGMEPIFMAARGMAQASAAPLAIHLDHARDLKTVQQALDLGFTSVMFDGSHLPYQENLDQTCRMVEMARRYGASAEGEIGVLPPSLENMDKDSFTRPEQAVEFARTTGVDYLAVSLGSVHGMQVKGATLDLELLGSLNEQLDCPMVLHGASGVVDEDIKASINQGIRKINVNTEFRVAYKKALKNLLDSSAQADTFELLQAGMAAVKAACRNRIRVFGASGKAVGA